MGSPVSKSLFIRFVKVLLLHIKFMLILKGFLAWYHRQLEFLQAAINPGDHDKSCKLGELRRPVEN